LRGNARPAEALRGAQLAVKDEYSHPYYWASFILVGGR
jgi:CHAT domain-containing protein